MSSSSTPERTYQAFISYRHADNTLEGRHWATWLHQAIETYQVPDELVGKKNSRGEEIPERIFPIFRDEDELPADADLGNSIANALKASRLLVVVCSPNAVASTYVADEIDYFKRLGHSDRIIAMIIDGEPNVSWDTSKHKLGFSAEQECFPELLVQCISGTSYDDYVSAPISEIRELDGDEQQDVFNDFLSSNGISDEHFQVN